MTRRVGHIERDRFGIGFVGSILYGPLPGMLRRFQTTYPSIRIDMQELTSVQQVTALKDGSIDVGFGRLHVEDATIQREVLIEEPLVVALPIGHSLLDRAEPLSLAALISEPLIVYPVTPRPSYAILQQRGLKPALTREVRELQTALGLVAAGVGLSIVPDAVQRFRRDEIVYRALQDQTATSPIIMCSRASDQSPEVAEFLKLVQELYKKSGKNASSAGANGIA
jgi:DNA-binding transcriptional LysR family regulator